jgi:hypothetical protein
VEKESTGGMAGYKNSIKQKIKLIRPYLYSEIKKGYQNIVRLSL